MGERPRDPKEMGIETEKESSPFSELVRIAKKEGKIEKPKTEEEIREEMSAPELAELKEMREGVAQEKIDSLESRAFDNGHYEYLALSGDEDALRKEEAPGMFSGRNRTEYVHVGPSFTIKLDKTAWSPEAYLDGYDEMIKTAKEMEEKGLEREGPDFTMDEFLKHNGESIIVNRSENKEGELIRVKDIDPKKAKKLFEMGYGQGDRVDAGRAREQIRMAGLSLEGFSRTALEKGDIKNALEGFSRIGKFDDEKVMQNIKEELIRIMDSDEPDKVKKVEEAKAKILELEERMAKES